MATPINPENVQDFDQPLNTTPDYSVVHVFSTNDVTGTFDGLTQGDVPPGETPVIDFTADPKVTNDGVSLYPINSEFGFLVTDFDGAVQKDFVLNPEYEEGFAGDLLGDGGEQIGLVLSDAPTDEFKAPALLGTWLAGLGGNSVKASTEHYIVMQNILSDQRYPGDPDAEYPLDDNLVIVGGTYDGQFVADVIPIVGDVNGDGVEDIKDVLAPNETTIAADIAVSTDYSVTLKDDGKLLYRWGNMVKRPNDIRLEVEMPLPDEWKTPTSEDPDVMPLYRITSAELVTHHTITNNPNDQVRPEDYENESAIGTLPTYEIVPDYNLDGQGPREVWVSTDDYYAGDGTLYPAGTILKDQLLADQWAASDIAAIGANDGAEGFTNAWYTTMDREPFEPVLNETETDYDTGPRWRLKPNKYGQDLPGVEVTTDPSSPPPPRQDEIKYETGAETQTVLNLLDWEFPVSPLSISAGWMNNAGEVSENGLNLTDNFDVSFYVKGDIKPATLYSTELLMDYEEIDIAAAGETLTGTAGDDHLAGRGGNTFTGDTGTDLFVVGYATALASLVASTINDFEVGTDILGLINHGVDDVTFDTLVTQTVDAGNLTVSIDGTDVATLNGVDEALAIEDFLLANYDAPTAPPGVITGTEGDDDLLGTENADEILALGGNDSVQGLGGDDTIDGGAGDDVLNGGDGNDVIDGGDDDDVLIGLGGDDTLDGGSGDDILNGGEGNDRLVDGSGANRFVGDAGDDTLVASGGTERNEMYGGTGADTLLDGSGGSVMFGNAGNDRLIGGGGNDQLFGGVGNDVLNGGNGADRLRGDAGDDYLLGGGNTDLFIFNETGIGADRVADFVIGEDRMFLSSTLTGGETDAASVVATFASLSGADVVFDFGGGDTVTLLGLGTTVDLADDLIIA